MLNWLFTPQCAACATPASTLCEVCASSLVELGEACARCAEPIAAAGDEPTGACARCAAHPLPLAQILAPWQFGGALATAIRRLKFTRRTHLARDLAPLWSPLLAAAVGAHDAIVVPVPLHWRRRFARGYDHAWLLAVHACAAAGLPAPRALLRRDRHALPQSTLAAAARRDNLQGAFSVRDPGPIAGRVVVLVDDVVTTGATLAAAARPLLAAGASAVIGVALARATSARAARATSARAARATSARG